MKRLTQKDEQGNWSLRGVLWESLHEGQAITKELRERLYGALWKLMEYEDTGLTPNEVEQLKESWRWIPVEEGLPKRNGVYNITRYVGGNYMRDSAYFDGQDTWHNDNRVNHSRCYLTDVIAWMPLPRPYDEEEN